MKKLFTLMMAIAIAMPTFAQFDGSRKTRNRFNHSNVEQYYGVRLGLNVASINSSTVGLDMNSYAGLALGGVYGLQLANSTPLWLEIGAFYSEMGGKDNNYLFDKNDKETRISQKKTTRLMYLKAPIVFKYEFDVADDFYVQPFLGGYFALGIGGKTKLYEDKHSYDSFDDYNRFDGGLRFGCGAEYQMVYAEIGFDFGIANICDDDFASARNQNFFINVGVNF
jgi:hypothetical protein